MTTVSLSIFYLNLHRLQVDKPAGEAAKDAASDAKVMQPSRQDEPPPASTP